MRYALRTSWMIVWSATLALGACGLQPGSTSGSPASDSLASAGTPTLAVPLAGDATAGRQAFLDLKCATCHLVPSGPEFPPTVSENPGPPLDGRLARSLPSYLATAIVSPSHELSNKTSDTVRARLAGTLSPMGDFTRVMTVRQLVDVHAFLASMK